jgi:hypothetical protein
VLFYHRSAPIWIGECTAVVRRDGRSDSGGESVSLDGVEGAGL